METPNLRDCYKKLHYGDGLTDEELEFTLKEFERGEKFLDALGPMFGLPWLEVYRYVLKMKEWKVVRDSEKDPYFSSEF